MRRIDVIIVIFVLVLIPLYQSVYAENFGFETVKVGARPQGIAVDSTNNMVYVANRYSGSVSVIDGANNSIVATIPLEKRTVGSSSYDIFPEYLSINPDTRFVYVSVPDDPSIRVIDGSTNREAGRIDIGAVPYDMVFNPKTNLLYVEGGNDEGNGIYVIDVTSQNHRIITKISTDSGRGMAINTETNTLYSLSSDVFAMLSGESSGSISIIDTKSNTVEDTIEISGSAPSDIAVNTLTNTVYVTASNGSGENGLIYVIDGRENNIIKTVSVGKDPAALAVNPVTNLIFVVDYEDEEQPDTTYVIDGSNNEVIATLPFGGYLSEIAVNPESNTLYVGSHVDDGSVYIFDASVVPEFHYFIALILAILLVGTIIASRSSGFFHTTSHKPNS